MSTAPPRHQTSSAASASATPPAAAFPPSAATTSRSVVVSTSSTRSSIALMFSHDSCAGSAAPSITFRWMPLEKKSRCPPSTSTDVGRVRANRSAASSRRQWSVLIAPPGKENRRKPAGPSSW